MKVPTFREAESVLGIDRNPLEHFIMNWEPSLLIDDPLNAKFRVDLQQVIDWLDGLRIKEGVPHTEWESGWISSDDRTCSVQCDCGEILWVSDSEEECPNCHKRYIVDFICYRRPSY